MEDKREGKLKDGRVGVEDYLQCSLRRDRRRDKFPAFNLETFYWEGENGYENEKDRAKSVFHYVMF